MNSDINDESKTTSPFLATSPNENDMNSTHGHPSPAAPPGDSIPPPYPYPQPGNPYSQPGNPYSYNNQQPPNVGFLPQPKLQPQPNNSANDAIMATQALNAAIHQNGRTPITVVCPSCRNTVMTEITEVENNTVTQGQSKVIRIFFGGTLVVFLTVFIAAAFISGSFIPLFITPVILIFVGFGFFLMRTAGRNAALMCKDIQHHCGSCKILLGVSSGQQFYQQMQMRTMDHRRRL